MLNNESLEKEIQQLNKTILKLDKHHSLSNSFLRGVFYGLGSVVGATMVVALLAYLLRNIELIPIIGTWVAQIAEHVSAVTKK